MEMYTIVFHFHAVKIKWQLVSLLTSWLMLSNLSRLLCLWWSYTILSSWTQGAAVKGLNYLRLVLGSWRCPGRGRLLERAFAHITELSGVRLVATDGSLGVRRSQSQRLSKINSCFGGQKWIDSPSQHLIVTPNTLQQHLERTVWSVAVTSPAFTIRPKRIRLESRKSCFAPLKSPGMKCWLSATSTGGEASPVASHTVKEASGVIGNRWMASLRGKLLVKPQPGQGLQDITQCRC